MSSINFLGNTPFNADNVERRFREIESLYSRLQSGQTVIKTFNSAISNAVNAAVKEGVQVRRISAVVTAGSVPVAFDRAMNTTDYTMIVFLIDSNGSVTPLGTPTAKTLANFTYTYDWAGTVVGAAIADK